MVIPVVGVGKVHPLDILPGHAVDLEHQLDSLLLLAAPPVVLDGVEALRDADPLPLEVLHPVDRVLRADQQAAPLVGHVAQPDESRAAQVGLRVDRRKRPADTDEVVHVVDVVRVPVVLAAGTQVGVLDADLLQLLLDPTELLVDVARRDEGAVGVIELAPVERDTVGLAGLGGHGRSLP